MSKRTETLELHQCDHVDKQGKCCANDGNKDVIKSCQVCHMDLCKTHCQITTVVFLKSGGNISALFQGHRLRFLYYFCEEHSDLFSETITKRYGVGANIPSVGDGSTLM